MNFDPDKIIVVNKDELLIGKTIFNFITQTKMWKLSEVEILESWMNDFSKRGVPFIITDFPKDGDKIILTLWKEEKAFMQRPSTIVYKGRDRKNYEN